MSRRYDLNKLTSEEAYALINEITDEQAVDSDIGGDSDAEDEILNTRPPSIALSRTSTRNPYVNPLPSTSAQEDSELNLSDDSVEDPDYVAPENVDESDSEDDYLYEEHGERNILEDSENEEEPALYYPRNEKPQKADRQFTWSKKVPALTYSTFIFDQPFGSKHNIESNSPLSVFQLFMDENMLQIIVDQSNLYAAQGGTELVLTVEELKAFLGLLILFGFNNLPSIRLYWSNNPNFYNERVAKVMTMKRFLKILRYVHLADNSVMPKKSDANYDKLYKIRPLASYLSEKFKDNFNPSRNISIDESMVAFKGRSTLKQYMPLKPIKRGFKVWAMACSQTGYLIDFKIYEGKSDTTDNLALGERVVLQLSQYLSGRGYCLYYDNFFSSFELLHKLAEEKLFGCGTFRTNRKFFPKSELCADKSLSLGQCDFASSGEITVYKWKDRSSKPVIVASNMHNPSEKTTVHRRNKKGEREAVVCPSAIRDYNLHMGGVDMFDQLHSSYNISWKSRRWWMKIFYYLIDAAVVNSYIAYKTAHKTANNNSSKCMTHLQFRSALVDELIGTFCSLKKRGRESDPNGTGRKNNSRYGRSTVANSVRLSNVGNHLPVTSTYRRCAFCSTKEHQKRSNMICQACNVALCKGCFHPYHNN